MTDIKAMRAARLAKFNGVPRTFEESIVDHLDYSIAHFQSSAVLVYSAEQNLHKVRAAIVRYVAQRDNLRHLDPDAYSSYEIALQELYLRNTIIVQLNQKIVAHPDYTYTSMDVSGFNKVFFDHESNVSDPE